MTSSPPKTKKSSQPTSNGSYTLESDQFQTLLNRTSLIGISQCVRELSPFALCRRSIGQICEEDHAAIRLIYAAHTTFFTFLMFPKRKKIEILNSYTTRWVIFCEWPWLQPLVVFTNCQYTSATLSVMKNLILGSPSLSYSTMIFRVSTFTYSQKQQNNKQQHKVKQNDAILVMTAYHLNKPQIDS